MTSRKRATREIDAELVDTVERLRRSQVAIKQIARDLHICRKTIRAIDRSQHVTTREGKRHVRCGGCGGKCIMPCRLCAARAEPSALRSVA